MYITITFRESKWNQVDVYTDENQTIKDVIKILATNLMPDINKSANFVKTMRHLRVVSTYSTFREAGILNGDIIDVLKSANV